MILLQSQKQNDLLASAAVQGIGTGLNANQQAFQQAAYNQMQPINVINALRTGSQVQNPSFVNTPMQAQTAGPDLLGAANASYQNQLAAYNAQQAAQGGLNSGLFGLGAAGILGLSANPGLIQSGLSGLGGLYNTIFGSSSSPSSYPSAIDNISTADWMSGNF